MTTMMMVAMTTNYRYNIYYHY